MDAIADAPQAQEMEPLYLLCTAYTWGLLALNVLELFTGIAPPDHSLSAAYFAFLAAYGGHREIRKWNEPELDQSLPKRNGERFVLAWGIFLAIAVILSGLVRRVHFGPVSFEFHFPHELLAITLESTAVLTGTKISKSRRIGAPLLHPRMLRTKTPTSNPAA